MKKLHRANKRSMRERLAKLHVPLPTHQEPSEALAVFVRGEPIESIIFRISPGLSGCALSITCATEVASGVYFESGYAELNGGNIHFELLPDPWVSGGRPMYKFPGSSYTFARAESVNHEFPGTLYPGRPWDGFFLGISYQLLPFSFRGRVPVHFVLMDSLGREASADLTAWVNPTGYEVPGVTRRGSLFEKDEADELGQSIQDFDPSQ
jgi:hypothetical protein